VVDFFTLLFSKVTRNARVEHITTDNQYSLLKYILDVEVKGKINEADTTRVRNRLASLGKRRPEILAFVLTEARHFNMVFMRKNGQGQVEVFLLDSMFHGEYGKRWSNIQVGADSEAVERSLM